MENQKIFVGTCILCVCFCFNILHKVTTPYIIEQRAKELNIMEYDGKLDKFVFKHSVTLNSGELYYLQNGTTK
jgi:hypothetical protein